MQVNSIRNIPYAKFAVRIYAAFLTESPTVDTQSNEVVKEREDDDPGPLPGEPPKIWGLTDATIH